MNEQEQKIEALKKVSLSLEAGNEAEEMDLSSRPIPFEMVVGLGTEGYTPFEYELLGKKAGDTVEVGIMGGNMVEMFGHLDVPLPEKVQGLPSFFLRATVREVVDADQREVVRAMAGAVGGCGGSCCGSH